MKKKQTFDQAFDSVVKDLKELMLAKQRDYGPNNILACPVGAEIGVLVRASDKVQRLANLYKNGKKPNNESLDDSWMDIANYGIIALMVRRKIFNSPLKEVKK